MTFEAYLKLTEAIIEKSAEGYDYANEDIIHYTQLNHSRMKRWLKVYEPNPDIVTTIKSINTFQNWILISEPWCGDAAHIVPIIYKLSLLNQNIKLDIQLRDQPPFLIDAYLTNGGKSIPILVIRNENNEDIAVWGPRPKGAKELFANLKAQEATFETIKVELQNWYNNNKAEQISKEILALIK
jgi:hypothetical protein